MQHKQLAVDRACGVNLNAAHARIQCLLECQQRIRLRALLERDVVKGTMSAHKRSWRRAPPPEPGAGAKGVARLAFVKPILSLSFSLLRRIVAKNIGIACSSALVPAHRAQDGFDRAKSTKHQVYVQGSRGERA